MAAEDCTDAERAPLMGLKPRKDDHNSCEDQHKVPIHISQKVYLSHFLSTWNSRVFEFGSVLYLAAIFPGTLVPMSLYALTRGLSAIVFSPIVGSYIDTANRLQVVRVSISSTTALPCVPQRLAVAASCIAFYILARVVALDPDGNNGLLALLAVLACVEKVCSIMNSVSVEKDWVVFISGRDDLTLRTMNSQMRRIDLMCKILGPLFITLIDSVSTTTTIVVTFAMNVVSLVIEYYAIALVYHDIPELQVSKKKAPLGVAESSEDHPSDSELSLQSVIWGIRPSNHLHAFVKKFVGYFSFYHHHRDFLPSIAVALLSLTVLSFGGQMITYLLSLGYSSTHVGVARTLGVLLEILATWLAPWLIGLVGPVRAGLWLSLWQLTMLVAGTMVFFLAAPEPTISVGGLVIGVIFSRLGLRGFELCVQIIVQQDVEAESRGAFSSAEAAYQNFFEMFSFASTLMFSRPDQFRWPVLISTSAIALASLLFTTFIYRRKGKETEHLWSPGPKETRN